MVCKRFINAKISSIYHIWIERLKCSQLERKQFAHKVPYKYRKAISKNAVLLGLPCIQNDNVLATVHNTIAQVGAQIEHDSIVSATRLFVSNKSNVMIPIQIEFKDVSVKEMVLSKKREFGKIVSTNINENFLVNRKPTTVSIRDELTPPPPFHWSFFVKCVSLRNYWRLSLFGLEEAEGYLLKSMKIRNPM